MINNDILTKYGMKLNPCKLCGKQAKIYITSNGSLTGMSGYYYNVSIRCSKCHNNIQETVSAGYNDDAEICKVVKKWNYQENPDNSSLSIDKKLEGFETETKKSFVRPCKVNNKAALFHEWAQRSYIVEESMLRGGRPSGQISYPVGIVEYKDGTVEEVTPSSIKFTDHFENLKISIDDSLLNKQFNFPIAKDAE